MQIRKGWGDNASGAAQPPAAIRNAVRIAAGAENSLALSADLQLWVTRSNQVPTLSFQTFTGRKYTVQHTPVVPGQAWTKPGAGISRWRWPARYAVGCRSTIAEAVLSRIWNSKPRACF
jgi:hypothetical protein